MAAFFEKYKGIYRLAYFWKGSLTLSEIFAMPPCELDQLAYSTNCLIAEIEAEKKRK